MSQFESTLKSLTLSTGKTVHYYSLPDLEKQLGASFAKLPFSIKSSMLEDLEHGKRLELNDLSGAVVRLGRELGIATPVHAVIHAALQPFVMGPPSR